MTVGTRDRGIKRKLCVLQILSVILTVITGMTKSVYAAYDGNFSVNRVYGHSTVYFGTTTRPVGTTCSYFGEYFKFDATTQAGKNMLSILLMAKATGKPIDVWYQESTMPDTNHTNGCTSGNMAVVTAIGVR